MISDRYQIQSELGRGGMGVAYRALDTLLGRQVAIKVVSESGLDTQGRARLLFETQATARLNHPNIVTVYDAGESDGKPYIVMELVDGKPLKPTGNALPAVLASFAGVCAALEAAHQQGIIHRDLKPENVLVTPGGAVKLMDFGLARQAGAPRLTTEGAVVGTANYLAPELLMGEEPTVRSDLYALGVMLYEFTTHHPLFEGADIVQQLTQHLYATVVPPSTHNPAIPLELESLILQLLEKQPASRPSSASQVGAVLSRLASAQPSSTAVAAPAEPQRLLNRMVRGRLVARDAELAEVSAFWQQASSGQGSLLLVSGEPGIGKTRLVRELVARVGFSNCLALLGECYAEGNPPYGPFTRIIPDALSVVYSKDIDAHVEQVILAELVQLAPSLAASFPEIKPNPPLDPQAGQLRAFDSVMHRSFALISLKPVNNEAIEPTGVATPTISLPSMWPVNSGFDKKKRITSWSTIQIESK